MIELPIADAEVPSSTPGDVDSERARLEGARILFVESDDESRELLATALEAQGAELWAVGRAREALETISSWRPDVIVSDITSHEEEGCEFLREVRALAPDLGGNTPAVALTALTRPPPRVLRPASRCTRPSPLIRAAASRRAALARRRADTSREPERGPRTEGP